jgi:hypothetical protein
MKTKWITLCPGVYVRRDDDVAEIFVTGDIEEPKAGGSNVVSTHRASIEQFADLVSSVSPEAHGKLVNVGTAEIPLAVPQSQAPLFQAIIAKGGAEALGELVNVGDDTNTLLLTKAQSEAFSSILVETIHAQVEKAVAEDRAARDEEAAALAKQIDATTVNVGADAGLKLFLQPGDAATHRELVDLAVQAASEKLTTTLAG